MGYIVNLGLPKSGTTTLQCALDAAGFRVADHLLPGPGKKPVAKALYDGYFASGNPLASFDKIDALGEVSILRPKLSLWPQMDFGLLSALRNHPDIRFVATWRPYRDIVSSMYRWRNMGQTRIPNGAIPGLPSGYGTQAEQLRWVAAHDAFLKQIFAGDPRFLRLEMSSPDTPQHLARHIGRAIPWWGRANTNERGQHDHM